MKKAQITIYLFLLCVLASSIEASGFKLTSPNSSVRWVTGDYHTISWTGIPTTAFVKLEYSTNGGDNWLSITDSAFGGSYIWHIPKAMSTHCLIRASSTGYQENAIALIGHQSFINTASFSRDGKLCATASDDATAIVWNGETGELLRTFKGHTKDVMFADISPDNSKLLTCSADGTAMLWNLSTGAVLYTLTGHTAGLVYGGFSPDGLLVSTSSDDGTARIWSVKTGELLKTIYVSNYGLYCAFFSPDNSMIITGGRDGSARIYDVSTGTLVHTLLHSNVVHWAGWSTDQAYIVTACRDGHAYIWNTQTYSLVGNLVGHTDWVWSAEFSKDGTQILTGGRDGLAKIWDPSTSKCLKTIVASTSDVGAARFSPDHDRVLTASNDDSAKIYYLSTNKVVSSQTDSLFTIFDPSASVDNNDNLGLSSKIVPNPTQGFTIVTSGIDWSDLKGAAIYNSIGVQIMPSKSMELIHSLQVSQSFDASNLTSGTYFLMLRTSNSRTTIPFAVSKE